jgi:hypothetical protein
MLSLRNWRVFKSLSKLRIPALAYHVDSRTDCAVNCVRALRPGRPKSYYRQFRGLTVDDLAHRLEVEGIPHKIVGSEVFSMMTNVIYLTQNHARVCVKPSDL